MLNEKQFFYGDKAVRVASLYCGFERGVIDRWI
jgi:hypothetical protein